MKFTDSHKKSLEQVSIITPSYNSGCFIAETIRSVLAQTYSNWEMIIVDDCSTDNTESIVKAFADTDPRIRYIRNEKNSGAAVSRNLALKEAKGRWIAFLDSDDLWKPEKLERQIQYMVENDYHFSYHEYDEIDENSKSLGIHVSGIRKVGKWGMYSCCWPGCLTVMYDREYVGLIQIEDIKKNNDTALWLKVVEKCPCYFLPINLASYRRRKCSITPDGIWGKVKAHYPLFHIASRLSPVCSWFLVGINVICGIYKKLFYVHRS